MTLSKPQSLFGKAVRYAYKNWEALTVFLENGRVEFDNNGIEHAIRPIAIGRKNWMHIGHIDAGDRAAVLYSIVASCRRLGIDVGAYLNDVLQKLPTTPADRIPELTPRNWRAAQQSLPSPGS